MIFDGCSVPNKKAGKPIASRQNDRILSELANGHGKAGTTTRHGIAARDAHLNPPEKMIVYSI